MAGGPADEALVDRIEERLRRPAYFREVLDAVSDRPYREILRAWSEIRTRHALERDEHGRYWRAEPNAAAPAPGLKREETRRT